MQAHIHPSLLWFACESRPKFNGIVQPGSASRTNQGPPRAQSPFARSRRYLHRHEVLCFTSEGVTPPSSLLRTHAPDQNPPANFDSPYKAGLCRLLPVPAGRWSFPTLSLQSVHRRLDPYPGTPLWCFYPFLPGELQPHPRCTEFGASNIPPHGGAVGVASFLYTSIAASISILPCCLVSLAINDLLGTVSRSF